MKKNVVVSIIMPAYNAEKFINEAVDSVLSQTYKDWELIIINDASSDNTGEIVDKYDDNRIRVFHLSKNSGVSFSRNYGISQAVGKYIAFLDSDDVWKKNKLEEQVRIVRKNDNIGLVFTGSGFIDENSKKYSYILNVPKTITYRDLLKQNIISCSSVLIQKEHILKYKMEHDFMHEDYASWLQMAKNNIRIVGINKPLLLYRISRNSKSSNKIKAAKMNWNVYRFMRLNMLESMYYMAIYSRNGIRKYKNIKRSSIK